MATIIGQCNNCGKCCLSMSLGGFMLENPCITRKEDRCKFYTDTLDVNKYGHCLIFSALSDGLSIEKVKDRYGKIINTKQIKWFYVNCPSFPTVKDIKSGVKLLDTCGFTIIK